MGVIIFNGLSSTDYGIIVESPPDYRAPKRRYDVYQVPGRNGDIYVDTGAYDNVERTYRIAVASHFEHFDTLVTNLADWLYSSNGYCRLEDSYDLTHYRIAAYRDSLDMTNILNHAGRGALTFDCKPQRYLKMGDDAVVVSSSLQFTNPTGYITNPKIIVHGTGTGYFEVNSQRVTLNNLVSSTPVIVDSEEKDIYTSTENFNGNATLSDGYPHFLAGTSTVRISGGIASLEVIPRWWRI